MTKIRYITATTVVAMLIALSVFFTHSALAETTMTPELTQRVKTHCVENLATLNRLQQADAFLRNNRGDLYRTISDKLMVPLNQRLASNQLDGSKLISVTADYNKEYKTFYSAYIAYDNALSNLLSIDCTKEPVTFYNALVDAREKRTQLSNSNQRLVKLIQQYKERFEVFKQAFLKEGDV